MRSLRLVITLALVLFGSLASFSAPGPPSGGGSGTPGCWPPPCVPVDGGISILIAAGAFYGAKKIYSSRKKSQSLS